MRAKRPRLVVVGNGMAGMRTVEELLLRAPDRFAITVVGDEPRPNYNRMLLSSVFAGDNTFEETVIHALSWYEERGITLIAGKSASKIDTPGKRVVLGDGSALAYDKLLLATGSKPLAPPIPGLSLPGVRAFRDMGDTEAMIEATRTHRRAVVIGGGLLGLEAAWGLKRRGMVVTVVHLMPTLMERQLDFAASELLRRELERRGIAIFTNSETEALLGEERVEAVQLATGTRLPTDFVVVAVGICPNIDLARAARLDANRGILVGDDMRTTDPDIYAVGECIEHGGKTFGLLGPIWEQAKVCGARLAGDDSAVYVAPSVFTVLKITGIEVFSAGTPAAADESEEELTLHDARCGIYKKIVLRDGKIIGCVLYGQIADGPWYVRLMRDKTDVLPFRDRLAFGRGFIEHAETKSPMDAAATPDDRHGRAWKAA